MKTILNNLSCGFLMRVVALFCSWQFMLMPMKAAELEGSMPIVAIWHDSDGGWLNEEPAYLRVAIWDDGRILFMPNLADRKHELKQGRVSSHQLDELKKAIKQTGVMELKQTTYLVPDASVDCVMVSLGAQKKILQWDEVEKGGYGINVTPTAESERFKKCWKEVNRLAREAIPQKFESYEKRFERPKSWR